MHYQSFFFQAFVFLAAAVIVVPVARRVGLGSVLGYLLAGVLIGPFVIGLVGSEGQDLMDFAEFGVVLMLFLVGLELQPALLWRLRGAIFGAGGLQIVLTALAGLAACVVAGLPWQTGLAIGMILAMSSTAIVLQTLAEKGLMPTNAGETSFSVLLFQDMAVIPIISLLPLLAMWDVDVGIGTEGHDSNWLEHLHPATRAAVTLGAVAAIVLLGRYGLRPVFRAVANTGISELFTALSLLIVTGIALLMASVGLSPALGTFLAGVVLANSEYRHELEADIAPFKGLLLGLFFVAVGSSIDFALISTYPGRVALVVAGLIFGKFLILMVVGKLSRLSLDQNLLFSAALAQGGEFCFVLLSFAASEGVVPPAFSGTLVASVALSMALSPILFSVVTEVVLPRVGTRAGADRKEDVPEGAHGVIIAGFGRFGNIVGRFLRYNGIPATILDHDSDQIDLVRQLGITAYYGDATRLDLLEAAGAREARLLIIAIDSPERSLELAKLALRRFPRLQIVARAVDREHAYALINHGVKHVVHESLGSSIDVGVEALRLCGFRHYQAVRAGRNFMELEHGNISELAALASDRKAYMNHARQSVENLEAIFRSVGMQRDSALERAWDAEPIRKEIQEDGASEE